MPENEDKKDRSRPIASAVLEGGLLLEMIHRQEAHQTALVVFQDGKGVEQGTVDIPRIGRVCPYSPDNNLLTHGVVLFPSALGADRAPDELLGAVRAFIHRYADLAEGFEEVASYYILLSWIYDAFSEVPYLRLKGDYGSGKSRCLQTIGSLCYKPMFVSGASTVSPMFRIIDAFRGTLIIDESDFRFSDEKAEVVKILNNGNAAGFPVLRSEANINTKEYNPRAFAVFGPKIIATRGDFEDRALESRCITEVMSGMPPRRDIPLSLPKRFHTEARELRNQLLAYRFKNLLVQHDLEGIRDAGVEARVAQVFAPLLAVVQDAETRLRIINLARGQSTNLRAERCGQLEAQILDIIENMRRKGLPLVVKDITERFAERHGSDFQRRISPRWIGAQLRAKLSLTPVKTHGVFVISESDYARLDSLMERYGVDVSEDVGMLGTSAGTTAALPF